MYKSVVLFLLFSCFTTGIFAQNAGALSLEVQGGVGSYTPFSDFNETVYTIEGRDFNFFRGNIVESELLPYVAVGLNFQLSKRWQVNPFVHYLFGEGTLYENDFTLFGVSDTNPIEQRFTSPADNEIKALTVGANLRYRLAKLLGTHLYVGSGIAYTTRSHLYRNELEVGFGADLTAQTIQEGFTTETKSAIFIPVSVGLERSISDHLTLTLNAQGLIAPNLEDRAWSAGIGVRYKL